MHFLFNTSSESDFVFYWLMNFFMTSGAGGQTKAALDKHAAIFQLFSLSRIPSCEEFIRLFATATSAAFLYFLGHSDPPPPQPRSAAARLHILCSGVCILCSGVCKPMSRHANLYSDQRAAARYGLHVKCAPGLSEQSPLPTFACLMSERSDVDVFPAHTHTPPTPPRAQAPSLRKC